MFRPTWLGRQLRTRQTSTAHRWFLAGHLVVVFLIIWFFFFATIVIDRRMLGTEHLISVVLWGGPTAGFFVAVVGLALALLAAGVLGLWYNRKDRRNVMTASIQAASYLGGYLVMWTLFASLFMSIMIVFEDWLTGQSRGLSWDPLVLAWILWVLSLAAGGYVYLRLTSQITAAARYANK
jgi:hypothetical protein